jgi:L-asparagine oxygenase
VSLCYEHIIYLNNDEIKILKTLASKIYYSPSEHPDLFCKQSKELSNFLPKNIKKNLEDFSKNGNHRGFLLIKNIPINDTNLGKTPESNEFHIGENTTLAKIQSIILNYIGDVIAYEAEGNGHIFQDIVPVKQMKNVQTSLGSNIELEVHIEQAFSKLKPDFLSLGCLRGDKNAFTYILPVQKIVNNLNIEEINTLFNPLWKTGVDLSFKLNNHEFIDGDIRGPLSILNGSLSNPTLIFDQDLMFGTTNESTYMIKKIVDIYYNNRIEHNLQPGEIILIDNNRAIHGRSSFSPNYDGNDRFLVRCFGTLNYEKTSYARPNGSRTVSAIYS